jgi:RND family efflux transporter MFP subunit
MRKRHTSLLLVGLAIALTGCNRGGGEAKQESEKAAGKETPTATTAGTKMATQVSIQTLEPTTIQDVVLVTGAITSQTDVTVGVKTGGKLQMVFGREGDVVSAGQVVARQDPADLLAQCEAQRAALSTAQSRLEQARVTLRNAQTTQKWTDDQTKAAVKQAQATLDVAKQQAALLQNGARPQEKKQAEENVQAAKADRDRARADLKRYQELYRQQAISAQQLDQAQSVADSAEARYNSAVQGLSLVNEGARVEDVRRALASVEQANQALSSAQSNREQVNLRRIDVENARAGIAAAESTVSQARASLRLAEQALRDLEIRSPINGVIAARLAEPGMQLSGAKGDVMRIVDLRTIYFDAIISETQYSHIRIGQPVEVDVYALQGKRFKGAVTKVFPVATAARTFTVRVTMQNEGNTLRPQMFANGKIILQAHTNALTLPQDAILERQGNGGRVFVVVNGTAEERKIVTGIVNGTTVEILEGLEAGDKVIIAGQTQLQKGDKVDSVPITPPTNTASKP